jgi:hypothetical protein
MKGQERHCEDVEVSALSQGVRPEQVLDMAFVGVRDR